MSVIDPHLNSRIPIESDMAEANPSLFQFAARSGKNLLSVIPAETKRSLYVKGPARIHYVCDPEKITQILVKDAAIFPKSAVTKNILGSAVGNGMILSEGQVWKDQRRRYAPLFAARSLPDLTKTFAETGQSLGRNMAEAPGVTDISSIAQDASLSDISKVMFSGSEAVSPDTVRDGLKDYTAYVADMSLFDLLGLPSWVPRLKWFKSSRPVANMRDLARVVIQARMEVEVDEPRDFLDLMVAAIRDDAEDLEQTVDNLLTFVVAGHETAANTLGWGLYLLAMFPNMQDAIRAEVMAACGEAPVTYDALEEMPLLEAHVNETLRLYPAAAFFARDVAEDCSLGDLLLKKGDAVFLPIYALHRHAALWDNPDAYQPDRFNGASVPRGQFIPFGDGPRVCIGAAYAKTEIKVLLASVMQQVRVRLGDTPIPKPIVTITMHPEAPIQLQVDAV